MKMKMSYDPGDLAQAQLYEELSSTNQLENLEGITAWTKASEIEMARWAAASEAVEARASGSIYSLVEELIEDRAFERAAGAYLAADATLEDLVYAAKRLLVAGQKVVLLDWDVTRGAGEELLSSVIPVIDIHQGEGSNQVDLAGGRAELIVHQGADDLDWSMTVARAGQLMSQLDGVDTILFLADDTATEEFQLEEDTVSMSASTVGALAGAWGASVLVAGGTAQIYQVLATQLEMAVQELR